MSETVFVVAHDGGSEGYGPPLAVFESRELAAIFVAGAEGGYNYGMKIFKMPIQNGHAPLPQEPEE